MGALGGMRRNVEVKARLRAREEALRVALRLRGEPEVCSGTGHGAGQEGRGQLIFYERPDSAGPKLSQFSITPTADPEGLQSVLSQSLGVLGTVTKERLLLLLGQTRVHLDRVQGLGDFLELEVVLRPEQSEQDGRRVALELLGEFGIGEQDLISGAYLDLLLAQGDTGDSGDSHQGQPLGGEGQQGTTLSPPMPPCPLYGHLVPIHDHLVPSNATMSPLSPINSVPTPCPALSVPMASGPPRATRVTSSGW
ncbi:hypothetical protein HGM15179_020637 [Zosterops borbonicus]|uniref:CYTH domain-containing protein n=1 Tax=Zosterops borbonicus TaxID=364589 RepID=A0A8K1FYD0_9PASS|nr:hypothetical protein HGM15179_020637 [Zosterops borbonicus]